MHITSRKFTSVRISIEISIIKTNGTREKTIELVNTSGSKLTRFVALNHPSWRKIQNAECYPSNRVIFLPLLFHAGRAFCETNRYTYCIHEFKIAHIVQIDGNQDRVGSFFSQMVLTCIPLWTVRPTNLHKLAIYFYDGGRDRAIDALYLLERYKKARATAWNLCEGFLRVAPGTIKSQFRMSDGHTPPGLFYHFIRCEMRKKLNYSRLANSLASTRR